MVAKSPVSAQYDKDPRNHSLPGCLAYCASVLVFAVIAYDAKVQQGTAGESFSVFMAYVVGGMFWPLQLPVGLFEPAHANFHGAIGALVAFVLIYVLGLQYLRQKHQRIAERLRIEQEQAADRRRKQSAKAAQLAESARNTLLNNCRYDKVINCPECEGEGSAIVQHIVCTGDNYSDNVCVFPLSSHSHRAGNEIIEGNSTIFWEQGVCPYCQGSGTAFAFFESVQKKCTDCSGTGRIVRRSRIKEEVGWRNEEHQTGCTTCAGQGKYRADIVHVLLKATRRADGSGFEEWPSTYSVEINATNRGFFSKVKQRSF